MAAGLAITYPEILEMQVRAIIEAAVECKKQGIKVLPEIMHPLVLDKKELKILEDATRRVADEIISKSGTKLEYIVGTMIELPRAALLANEIAEAPSSSRSAPTTSHKPRWASPATTPAASCPNMSMKRRPAYSQADPFQSLDTKGVGMLIKWGIEKGRSSRPKLKVGICGEHGGDLDSVKFCHQVGMDYVSASPYRVPISRLGAAQAVVEENAAKKAGKGKKK